MSGLLKGAAAARATRPLTSRAPAPFEIVAAEADPSPEILELETLRAECERLTEAVATAHRHTESAVDEAIEKGRALGREEARVDDEKKLELIGDALNEARSAWQARLTELDGLAALIAKASVEKVFGSWAPASELVSRAVAERLKALRREAVLAIRFSTRDFSDEAALGAAVEQISRLAGELIADPDLASGECRIDLTLGHIDIGPRNQFAALALLLDDLAKGRPA